ncbi:hypothetical protein Tco_1340697 [Tanacetum coccineum]
MSINSGKPAGSETASKAAMLFGSSQPKPLLFLDQLKVDVTGTIVRGQSLRVTLWGELGDVLVEKKTKHAGVCAMVLTGMSGKEYNSKDA